MQNYRYILAALAFGLPLLMKGDCGANGTVNTSLVGHWDGSPNSYADVWAEGDYAYVAHFGDSAIDIVNISDPANPTQVMEYQLPAPNGGASAQDVKVGDGLLFIGLESSGNAVHIVDVRDPENPVGLVDIAIAGFNSIHNVFYDQGYLYLVDSATPRVGIVDLTQFDPDNPPANPISSTKWMLENVGSGFVHDITVVNGRLYACAWDSGLWIFDVNDIANTMPTFLGSGPGNNLHSAWPTDDGRYVIVGEERTGGGIIVFRIDDNTDGTGLTLTITDNISVADASSVHNQVTIGYRVYNSWYGAGFRVYDVDPITGLLEFIACFDTSEISSVWGVYPFLGPDRVLLSDISNGLFIVSLEDFVPPDPDLNGDGWVNLLDMVALLNSFGACAVPDNCPEDLNGDNQIDDLDLGVLYDAWGLQTR